MKILLATATALLLAVASPASATEASSCNSKILVKSQKIDNPTKVGVQKWGDLKTYEAWCMSNGVEFRGVWSEGRRDDGGAIKIGISTHSNLPPYATYSLSRWGTGSTWTKSPVLEKESPGSYWSWADYSGGPLGTYT